MAPTFLKSVLTFLMWLASKTVLYKHKTVLEFSIVYKSTDLESKEISVVSICEIRSSKVKTTTAAYTVWTFRRPDETTDVTL